MSRNSPHYISIYIVCAKVSRAHSRKMFLRTTSIAHSFRSTQSQLARKKLAGKRCQIWL